MQFTISLALLVSTLSVIPAMAQPPAPSVLNYDTLYDNRDGTLASTQCSADVGPLKGHKTFGSLPSFPYISGAEVIEGFNSTRCGACYELLYNRADGTQVVKPFTIINSAPRGFISSLQAATEFTGLDRPHFLGDAPIFVKEVPAIDCGL